MLKNDDNRRARLTLARTIYRKHKAEGLRPHLARVYFQMSRVFWIEERWSKESDMLVEAIRALRGDDTDAYKHKDMAFSIEEYDAAVPWAAK